MKKWYGIQIIVIFFILLFTVSSYAPRSTTGMWQSMQASLAMAGIFICRLEWHSAHCREVPSSLEAEACGLWQEVQVILVRPFQPSLSSVYCWRLSTRSFPTRLSESSALRLWQVPQAWKLPSLTIFRSPFAFLTSALFFRITCRL